MSWDFGRIARTAAYSQDSSTVQLDPSGRTFPITGTKGYPAYDEMLEKVGRTTGWTWGQVFDTCVDLTDYHDTNIVLVCQDLVDGGISGGDSGSPVFGTAAADFSQVTFYGIAHGGRRGAGRYWVFSSVSNLQNDFTNLVFDP